MQSVGRSHPGPVTNVDIYLCANRAVHLSRPQTARAWSKSGSCWPPRPGRKMKMDKKELCKLADRYQAKADRAYASYQETGLVRYDRERCNNEDLADALRMAASAADDHAALVSMRGAVCAWAYQAQALEQIPEDQREDKTRRLLSNIAALARVWGLVGKMDDLAQAGKGEKEHEQR